MVLNPLDMNMWTIYLLVLARCAGMVFLFPYFSWRGIPVLVRVYLSVMLAVIIFLTLGEQWDFSPPTPVDALIMVMKELVTGLSIGFFMVLFFTVFVMTGEFLARQAGLMFARVFDPTVEDQVNVMGMFMNFMIIIFYLTINAHHPMIKAMADSFLLIPPGTGLFDTGNVGGLMRMSADMIATAFKIIAPISFILFIINFAMGLLAKTVTQLNVFFMMMPLKIIISVVLVAFLLPLIPGVLEIIFDDFLRRLYQFMQGWTL